jgi:Tfp pilus assembly protein PilF
MSIILDALRRGRAAQAPGPNRNAAQTDAVLQTLGYGRFSPTAPLNRLKRVLLLLGFAVVAGILIWVAVVWLTHAYFSSARPDGSDPAPAKAAAPTAKRMQLPQEPSTEAQSPPAIPAAPGPARAPVPTSTPLDTMRQTEQPADRIASSAYAPVATNAPSGPARAIVQPSRRASTASSAPLPTTAPSRSGMPTGTAAKGATITTGDDHFRRGVMYQRLGDFENALVSYRHVLQRDDLNVEAHNNLGVLYRDKGLHDDAITHFQRAIAINPGYARARNNLGVVYLSQRRFDAAASQFHAALALDAKSVESMVNLSTVEKESGRRDQARAWLTRALAADPRNAEAHYNLGLLEDESANRSQAIAHYRAFLQYGAAVHPALVADVRARLQKLEGESRN